MERPHGRLQRAKEKDSRVEAPKPLVVRVGEHRGRMRQWAEARREHPDKHLLFLEPYVFQ